MIIIKIDVMKIDKTKLFPVDSKAALLHSACARKRKRNETHCLCTGSSTNVGRGNYFDRALVNPSGEFMGLDPTLLPMQYRLQIEAQKYRENLLRNKGMGSPEPERGSPVVREQKEERPRESAPDLRPRVCITMYRCGKPLDRDNKWTAPKALLDGLVEADFIPGDQESEIDYRVEQVRVKTRSEIKTTIEIEIP